MTAEAIRHGYTGSKDAGLKSWKKNCSRTSWRTFYRAGLGFKVKIHTYDYATPTGEIIPISYISPTELVEYLLQHRPGVLVGGLDCPLEISRQVDTIWKCFKLHSGDHQVFEEYGHDGRGLENIIPIAWHGDEGRGKRRGNTVVVSLQSVIGVETARCQKRKHSRSDCRDCKPPPSFLQQYPRTSHKLDTGVLSRACNQWTTMRGHSFLQHFALFVLPSSIHHAYPAVLGEMLQLMAADLKRLFYEGVTVKGKHFAAAVTAGKGDLKWFCKIALERSFQNQGIVRSIPCCHECQAGEDGLDWEDMSEWPAWANTRYSQRPWVRPPPTIAVPFCRAAPEKQFKRDPFHCAKVGIYRDLAGSCICWMVEQGYYGQVGDFPSKLSACHAVFKLFCASTGRTAALRSFSRALFMYPRRSSYPWCNTKGSDTMILLSFINVQCCGFTNAPLCNADLHTLNLMGQTCRAAIAYFKGLNQHGLHMSRECGMCIRMDLKKFINGYTLLASNALNGPFNGWAVKPKLHLMKHADVELHEHLLSGIEAIPNGNAHNCEQDEDFIGRICRLSRRLDSRLVGQRVLQCALLKSHLLWRQFAKENGLRP